MILDGLYLYDGVTTAEDSVVINNVKGNMLVLQVVCNGTFSFKVKGCVDLTTGTYNDIAAIKMSDLSKADSVTSTGIYQADISGCRKVKLSLSAIGSDALTVYGTVKEG